MINKVIEWINEARGFNFVKGQLVAEALINRDSDDKYEIILHRLCVLSNKGIQGDADRGFLCEIAVNLSKINDEIISEVVGQIIDEKDIIEN